MGEELATGDEVSFVYCSTISHIVGTIVTNDIVFYHALPIKKNMVIVMTIGDDYFF